MLFFIVMPIVTIYYMILMGYILLCYEFMQQEIKWYQFIFSMIFPLIFPFLLFLVIIIGLTITPFCIMFKLFSMELKWIKKYR